MKYKQNAFHYNNITDAWPYILGENFHWGYFRFPEESLPIATDNLIEQMVFSANSKGKLNVLDVGCGIGGPAFYLHEKYQWQITGISNSKQGIQTANKKLAQSGLEDSLQFLERDALNNGLPSNHFDLVWVMEMSHLIEDKNRLIEECTRVLKPGGRIVLCDLTFQRPITPQEIYKNKKKLRILEKSFGKASLYTLDQYREIFENNDLSEIGTINVSDQVIPTLERWKENCKNNIDTILTHFEQEDYDWFIESCDILTTFYKNKIWGYGIVSAMK